jgi:hypothetical protein
MSRISSSLSPSESLTATIICLVVAVLVAFYVFGN